MLPHYTATRYIVPLREGGSLPAILDTDGGGCFVVKFRGAGQGIRALIAEIIVGSMAAAAGLPIPEIALVDVDESFGRSERDPEIQDLLKGSLGTNVGLRFLDGALTYDPVAVTDLDPALAADIVWLDAFTTNIDRSPRNPNMLIWEKGLWLIDHGAALYFHHNWASVTEATPASPFAPIRDHVLLAVAGDLDEADRRMAGHLTPERIDAILASIPDEFLMDAPHGTAPPFADAAAARDAYRRYFAARMAARAVFVEEARAAQERRRSEPQTSVGYRR